MEKEQLEVAEAERAIAEFSRRKETLMGHRQNLLRQIDDARQSIQKKRECISSLVSLLIFSAVHRKTGYGSAGIEKWPRTSILGGAFGHETRGSQGRRATDYIHSCL